MIMNNKNDISDDVIGYIDFYICDMLQVKKII